MPTKDYEVFSSGCEDSFYSNVDRAISDAANTLYLSYKCTLYTLYPYNWTPPTGAVVSIHASFKDYLYWDEFADNLIEYASLKFFSDVGDECVLSSGLPAEIADNIKLWYEKANIELRYDLTEPEIIDFKFNGENWIEVESDK